MLHCSKYSLIPELLSVCLFVSVFVCLSLKEISVVSVQNLVWRPCVWLHEIQPAIMTNRFLHACVWIGVPMRVSTWVTFCWYFCEAAINSAPYTIEPCSYGMCECVTQFACVTPVTYEVWRFHFNYQQCKTICISATKLKYSRHMGHKQSWWYKKCQQQQTLTVISVYSDNCFCWSLRLNCISHALGVTYCAINSITFKGHTVNVNCFGLLKVYSKWFRRVKKHLASFCKFNLIW